MISQLEVLKDVVMRLDAESIPYMLSGSMALNFYATPRMTRDIDIVIAMKKEDTERLVRTFQSEYYVDEQMIKESYRLSIPFNVIHLASVTKVDLILKTDTPFQRSAFARKLNLELSGSYYSVISPEDLVLAKLDWAKESFSEIQLRDVRSLLKLPRLDRTYTNKWVHELDLQNILARASQ